MNNVTRQRAGLRNWPRNLLDMSHTTCYIPRQTQKTNPFMSNLIQIKKPQTLTGIAYERLHGSIMSGELIAGEVYSEALLANKLGISRTPVREALLKLTEKGLVAFISRRGIIVNSYTKKEVTEIYELRKVIEVHAVNKLAATRRELDFSETQESLKQQKNAITEYNITGYLRGNDEFHRSLVKMTGNGHILDTYDTIKDILHVIAIQIFNFKNKERMLKVHKEHELLLRAIVGKDLQESVKLIAYHIDDSEKEALRAFAKRADKYFYGT